MNQKLLIVCAKCKRQIDPDELYFWGRDGGEWHAACFQQLGTEANYIRGMWIGQQQDNPLPQGLQEGAGI